MSRDDHADVTLELIRKYDRPGPRYTSYPTAVEFNDSFGPGQYADALERANRASTEPLSLYAHLPFCRQRCTFCGCHVVISRKEDLAGRYLGYLHREIDMLARKLPHRRRVTQYHWGGGTPTFLTVDQMAALHAKVREHFEVDPAGEVAIEVDPRATTHEQIDLLKELGFNRISMGVQDFDPDVQEIIHRGQTEEQTRELYAYCRAKGFHSVNLDLIYGLPLQTLEKFHRTVQVVNELRPDRIALYSYAHVPWVRAQQKWIKPEDLPSPETKLRLFVTARQMLLDGGYVAIGMDHFALPEDELATAIASRTLHRNFMGYTVKKGSDMVAVGISGIGDVQGVFAQNVKKLSDYYQALDEGRFPVERGYALDRDDLIRREVISRIMCNFHLDRREIETRFGIDFGSYFAPELAALASPDGPVAHGFLEIHPDHLEVVGNGRLFVRNVAMVFDRYLKTKGKDKPIFSRTV